MTDDRVLDTANIFFQAVRQDAVDRVRHWTGSYGEHILRFRINYPDNDSDETTFWIVYAASEKAIEEFMEWFKKFGAELTKPRALLIDGDNPNITEGPFFDLILNIPGGFSLDGCNATSKNNHKGYFAFVTTDGWHFDFEAEDQPIGPISLIVGNSLGPLDPFLADAQKILWEEVVPYLEAEYGIKMREAEA